MIKAILQGLLKALSSLLSLFLWPIDAVVKTLFPDLSSFITTALNGIYTFIDTILWPLSILPTSFHNVLTIIITLEIAYLTLFINTIIWPRIFRVIQKIKFW